MEYGKTGTLTPVAIFDSVDLAGTSVSRASLHNISIMKELNISIGSTVTVVKKNEIIPQIISCDANAMDADIPTTCPVCGGETRIVKENDSEVLMCVNPHCKRQATRKSFLILFPRKVWISQVCQKKQLRNSLNLDGLQRLQTSTILTSIMIGYLQCLDLERNQ